MKESDTRSITATKLSSPPFNTSMDSLRKNGYEPRFHNNGIIQLYINPRTRLHVWHPEFPSTRSKREQIHNHRFDFRSETVFGLMENTEYEVTPDPEGSFSIYEVFDSTEQDKQVESKNLKTPVFLEHASAKEVEFQYIPRGAFYYFKRGLYHSSRPIGLTITVMTKFNVDSGRARILSPRDKPSKNAFDNSYSTKELWDGIASAVAEWKK